MPTLDNYSILFDLYNTVVRYSTRFLVQRQLLAILSVLLTAGLLSALLVDWGRQHYVRWCWTHRRSQRSGHGRWRWSYRLLRVGAIILQQATFPR